MQSRFGFDTLYTGHKQECLCYLRVQRAKSIWSCQARAQQCCAPTKSAFNATTVTSSQHRAQTRVSVLPKSAACQEHLVVPS